MSNNTTPLHYGVVLFTGFQALDVFGPLDILNNLALTQPITLSIIAETLDPISTRPTSMNLTSNFGESVVPTHTFSAPPTNLDVLLVPGGVGTGSPERMTPVKNYIKSVFPSLQYLLTVCTGSAIVAGTGLLDNKRATTNKKSWEWATSQGPNVEWVPKARWVQDGNIWTSSGVSAGIDAVYGFVGVVYGEDVAKALADMGEYVRNTDPDNDPFAVELGM